MKAYLPVLVVLGACVLLVAGLTFASLRLAVVGKPLAQPPFLSGHWPSEHAMSRYHVRWYAVMLLFLAFDMEMVFMYPWAVVFADLGALALMEMGMFLLVLMLGVLYAWREGALRWV